jgi:hypothetical protein
MKSLFKAAVFCFVFIVLAVGAYAKNSDEVGIVLGNPSGFSGKFFLNDKNAVDVVVGLDRSMSVHADYLWHDFEAFEVNEGVMPLYYGAGVLITDKGLHLQGKIGLEYLFETNPLGIFIEVAPAFGPDFRFQGGLGVRYRLK